MLLILIPCFAAKGRKRKKIKREEDVEHLEKMAVEMSEDGTAKTMPSQADAQVFSKCFKGQSKVKRKVKISSND